MNNGFKAGMIQEGLHGRKSTRRNMWGLYINIAVTKHKSGDKDTVVLLSCNMASSRLQLK
jgi:hypothetical protein